jgi:hypothetical protein
LSRGVIAAKQECLKYPLLRIREIILMSSIGGPLTDPYANIAEPSQTVVIPVETAWFVTESPDHLNDVVQTLRSQREKLFKGTLKMMTSWPFPKEGSQKQMQGQHAACLRQRQSLSQGEVTSHLAN